MKLAISIPDPVFNATERLAQQRRIPRSRLVAEALEEYVCRHGTEAITQQLDTVYTSENSSLETPLIHSQLASIEHEAW